VTRAFVAVRVPELVLDAIAGRVSDLALPGRRTQREQWHLTLQFLGNSADVDAVATALGGITGPRASARIGGAGAFPDVRRARVLWLGLLNGAETLSALAGAVSERMAPLGHAAEARPFRPHVTLARYRAPTDVRAAVAAIGDAPVGPGWEVDALTVYESRLRSDGAEYVARATIPIIADPPPT